ncbi:MAG: glutamate--tRNA ligase [Acidimicrobiales bacterium]
MSDRVDLDRRGVNTEIAPRVRFAPSPTGYFHVGGARTALYNWLVARKGGGQFVLRIEDTDRERSKPEWIGGILSALEWLGIDWDEGPYLQSERSQVYADVARRLYETGHAYACDCTREQIEERTKQNAIPGYDEFCRNRHLEPGLGRALRFHVPDDGVTIVQDVVRGAVEFQNSTIEDFVLVKSNGDPLFVLAVVADDRDMRITHVIRAEEHLPTTPKAVLIWEALGGLPLPVFAHLPVLVNEKRQKLSKRRDRVAIEDHRAQGYLPEAMRNYLVLLGWGPPDQREILTVGEMIDEFRLEDVNVSPAFFDEKRLDHFNGVYIRALSIEDFVTRTLEFLETAEVPWNADAFDASLFVRLAPLIQERVTTLADVIPLVAFLFSDPFVPEPESFDKAIRNDPEAKSILETAREGFAGIEWNATSMRPVLDAAVERTGRKLGKVQAPVRVATLGSTVGLPLFESLEELGRDRTIARIEAAIAAI